MHRRFCATLVVLAAAATAPAPGASGQTAWAPVPAADLAKLRPADFADEELDLPYYLAHFHRVVNSVVEDGQDRGFIGIPVWRSPQDNKPYNARIMEGILSLAFFYSTKRPWNIYYASDAVRPRLEAALDFFSYIRQPAYYAAFNSGERLTAQQRYGIGLVWHPQAGSVLQSQTATREAAWGTAAAEGAEVYEADTLRAEFFRDGSPVAPQPGNRDLPRGALRIRYPLADKGEKTLRFEEREIVVSVQHAGVFREQIPLLLSGDDSLKIQPGLVSLTRRGKKVTVRFDEGALPERPSRRDCPWVKGVS